jgi:hypothetical protein
VHGGYRLVLSAAFALSGLLTLASSSFADDPTCDGSVTVVFKRKADRRCLPSSQKSSRWPMSVSRSRRQMWGLARRYRRKGSYRPSRGGCDLAINYEQGGRGYSHGLILLRHIGGDWTVRHGSSYPYSRLEHNP